MEFLNLCKEKGKDENKIAVPNQVRLLLKKGNLSQSLVSPAPANPHLLYIIGGVDVKTSGKIYLEEQNS